MKEQKQVMEEQKQISEEKVQLVLDGFEVPKDLIRACICYLPEGKDPVPETVANEVHLECDLIEGNRFRVTKAYDWGEPLPYEVSSCGKKGYTAEAIPRSLITGLTGYVFHYLKKDHHPENTMPFDGRYDIFFKSPGQMEKLKRQEEGILARESDRLLTLGNLHKKLPEDMERICLTYLPPGKYPVPETVYNEVHFDCTWNYPEMGKFCVTSASDWDLEKAKANEGLPVNYTAEEGIPLNLIKGLEGYVYNDWSQDTYPCNGGYTVYMKPKASKKRKLCA